MTRLTPLLSFWLLASGFWLLSSAEAQVPGIINYQGRIVDNGTNFTGTGQFEFALINGTSGTTNYWANDGTAAGRPGLAVPLSVTKGLYSVLLGDTTVSNMTVTIPATVFTNSDVRLRVWFSDGVNAFQQLGPDLRLAAVGYAMMANGVPTGAITTAQLASNAVTAANLAPGAVTATGIANGAVGPNQLATNAVSATSLAANGALVSGLPAPVAGWAEANPIPALTNSYFVMVEMLSSNFWESSYRSWVDIWGGYMLTSHDGTNLTWYGPQPNFGFEASYYPGPVNDPDMWFGTNGFSYFTWSFAVDTATNKNAVGSVITSWPTNGFVIIRSSMLSSTNFVQTGVINCSALAPYVASGSVTSLWVIAPQMETTLTTNPTNLFFSVATNYPDFWGAGMTTAQDAPNYTQWSTPVLVPIDGVSWFGPIFPCGLNWNGTNMVLYNQSNSLWLATNTISASGTYTAWKGCDWGHWTNAFVNGNLLAKVYEARIAILPDRKRITFDSSDTNGTPLGTYYSDCFDDWQTWTAPAAFNSPLFVTNYYGAINTNLTGNGTPTPMILRAITTVYVPNTFVANNNIAFNGAVTFNGVASFSGAVNGLNVVNGLTADNGTITGSLTVSNGTTIQNGTLVLGTTNPVGLSFCPVWWTNAGVNRFRSPDVLNFVDTSTGTQTDTLAGAQSPIYIIVTNATISANPLVLKAGFSSSAQFLNNNGSYYTVTGPGIIIATAPKPGSLNRTMLLDGTAMATNGAPYTYTAQAMTLGSVFTNQSGHPVQYVEQAVFNESATGRAVLRGSNITQRVGWDWSFPGGLSGVWTDTVAPIFASPNDQILYQDVSTGSGASIVHYRLDAVQRP